MTAETGARGPDAAARLELYRPNVGVVLFNPAGKAWLGRRINAQGPHNWQFPQGGVDKGEALYPAALRELREETGVVSVAWLGRTEDYADFAAEGYLRFKRAWLARWRELSGGVDALITRFEKA